MRETRSKHFKNGVVYALETDDGYPIEVTDTFLPTYTRDAASRDSGNALEDTRVGDRSERWMIGVSCMSGCPVGCKFCATSKLPRWRNLTASEIVQQVEFVLVKNNAEHSFQDATEHKINYTRMGEPFLNIEAVKEAIEMIEQRWPGTHHYVSTIGMKGSDFSWIRDNVTLQVSLHSLDESRRDELIPVTKKLTIEELGSIRTESHLKTTLNLTLVDEADFDIARLRHHFDPARFFIKLSPINPNDVSIANSMGTGVIDDTNVL